MGESGSEIMEHDVHEKPMSHDEVIERPPARFEVLLRQEASVETEDHRCGECDDKEDQSWADDMRELIHNPDERVKNGLHDDCIVRKFIVTENAVIKQSLFSEIVRQGRLR